MFNKIKKFYFRLAWNHYYFNGMFNGYYTSKFVEEKKNFSSDLEFEFSFSFLTKMMFHWNSLRISFEVYPFCFFFHFFSFHLNDRFRFYSKTVFYLLTSIFAPWNAYYIGFSNPIFIAAVQSIGKRVFQIKFFITRI